MLSGHTVLSHRQEWLWSPANFKGTELKDAKIDIVRYTTGHKLLCCSHTLCVIYETVPFLLVSSSGRVNSCCGMCTFKAKTVNTKPSSETQGQLMGTKKSRNFTAGEGRRRKVAKKAGAPAPRFVTDFFSLVFFFFFCLPLWKIHTANPYAIHIPLLLDLILELFVAPSLI